MFRWAIYLCAPRGRDASGDACSLETGGDKRPKPFYANLTKIKEFLALGLTREPPASCLDASTSPAVAFTSGIRDERLIVAPLAVEFPREHPEQAGYLAERRGNVNAEKRPAEVVVITGASAGVGRATARAFAERGARAGLLARGQDGLNGGFGCKQPRRPGLQDLGWGLPTERAGQEQPDPGR
jgi:hypothetical protein